MAKDFARAFYKSKAWLKCREGFIASVYGLCNRCGSPGHIVHHKTLLTPNNINNPYISLNWDELEYLCQDCHNREHHASSDEVIREGLMFDESGNLIQVDKDTAYPPY